MTSLTEFLLARTAEDKARVASLTDDDWESEFGRWAFNGTEEPFLSAVLAVKPSRVLAECEAKRSIVERHKSVQFTSRELGLINITVCWTCHGVLDEPDDWDEDQHGEWSYPWVQDPWPCRTVRALAVVHADHPDYLPEWRPDPVNAE